MVYEFVIDIHEMTSSTVLSCSCGTVTRNFIDNDSIGNSSGNCVDCGITKIISDIIPNGRIPLFPHVIVKYFKENKIPYTRMSLTTVGGDYILQSAKKVIERKTVADFINSWLKGDRKGKLRWDGQLKLCMESYRDFKIVLLLEDFWKCGYDFHNKCIWVPTYDEVKVSKGGNPYRRAGYYKLKTNPKSFFGKLDAMEKRSIRAIEDPDDDFNRVEIVKCYDAYHCLDWILSQLSPTESPVYRKRLQIHRVKKPLLDLHEQKHFFLEGLPGIGPNTSEQLINVFKGDLIEALIQIDKWPDLIKRPPIKKFPFIKDILGMKGD